MKVVKILASLSILNSSGASPGATKKVVALLVAALVTALVLSNRGLGIKAKKCIRRSNCTNGVVRSRGMGYEKC